MSGSGSITDGVPNSGDDGPSLPDWISDLRSLIGVSVGTGATTYYLVDEPIAFIQFVLIDRIQQTILDVSGAIGARLIQLNDILLDSTIGVLGTAVGDSISFVGESIIGLIDAIGEIAQSLAAGAGPLGIIIIPLVWAGAIIATGAILVGAWRAYLLIRSAII